jgi:hypothetical protein
MNKKTFYIVCLSFMCLVARGQSFNGTINPSVGVATVLNLNVVQNISSISFSTYDQFNNGVTVSNYSTLQLKTNVNWTFSASTTTQYFSASGSSASPNMPASILQMALSTNPTYYTLSTTPQQINAGTLGDLTTPGNIFNVNLKATPGYDYGPGTYSITITYTIAAQ